MNHVIQGQLYKGIIGNYHFSYNVFVKFHAKKKGPHSAVSNMSANRCESDCRYRDREFDPRPVSYFVEIDREIISMVILLPSTESFKKGCCQLQAKVCARSTG